MNTGAGTIDALTETGMSFEVIRHAHTERASDEAVAIGVEQSDVGKTIVLTSPRGYVRAVLPASKRLDLHKLRRHLNGGNEIRLATEAELVGAYPTFELGAVSPFGGPPADLVVVDRHVADRDWVIVEAGTHEASVRIRTSDLVSTVGADVVDICCDE